MKNRLEELRRERGITCLLYTSFAGHYGLERYDMIEAYNLGSQVPNEEFLRKAAEVNADVLLVSQTVTQKDVHIQNLTELIELAEAEGVRDKYIFCCGGARKMCIRDSNRDPYSRRCPRRSSPAHAGR